MTRRLVNVLVPLILAWAVVVPSLSCTFAFEDPAVTITVEPGDSDPTSREDGRGADNILTFCCFLHGSMASTWTVRPEPPRAVRTIRCGPSETGYPTGDPRDIFRPPRV